MTTATAEPRPYPRDPSSAQHREALRFEPVEGGRLAYLDIGPPAGEPLLLLHGIPTSSWLYRRVAARLAADGFRVVAPDLLGFGASDKPSDRAVYTAARQSERVLQLLDTLGLERVTMVVHDAGGPWGFELADQHPGRLAGLVILNTTAHADAFRPPAEVRALGGPLGPLMLRLMRSAVGRPMVHRMISQLTHAGRALDKGVTAPHWEALRDGGTHAMRAFGQGLPDFVGQLPRYSAALQRLAGLPAMVIWGTEDPVLRPDRLVPRFTADLQLAPSDVHLLDRASHFLQEDRPDDISALLATFVRERVIPRHPTARPTTG